MSRTFALRTSLWSLVAALGLGSVAYGQPGRPRPPAAEADDGHGHGEHDHDEEDDEGGAARPPRVFTPEDEARRKQVVARVEGVEITIAKVEDYIDSQSPMLRARYKDPAELKKLVENMVRFELLAAEADRQGYGKNKVVVRTLKDGAVQNLLRTEIEEKVTPQSVTDDEIKAYYDQNAREFHREEQRRASYILVDSEAEAKQVLAEVQKADARGFIELAKKHSKDLETKVRGGDLGFFTKEAPKDGGTQVPPAVRKVAFDLKEVGDTAPKPVALDGTFAVVRLTGQRPERNTSLEEAEHPIRTKLWREKRQNALTALVEGLRAKEQPKVFADKVDLVKLDDMEKQPGGFPVNPHGGAMPNPHGGGMPVNPHGGAMPAPQGQAPAGGDAPANPH